MNSEPTDMAEVAAMDAAPPHPAELLRTLLDEPKPKDEAWQAQAGRAVSILAVGFLKESDDEAALRAAALLSLAQSLGVKEARRRAIKLSRWAVTAPPALTTLPVKDEQQAALTALAKLTTPWSRQYAEQAIADLSLPEDFLGELLKWARATFPDNLSFVREFYAPQVAAVRSAERTAALLKDATKLLRPSKPEPAAKLAECSSALIGALCQSARPVAAEEKAFGSSVAGLLHLVQDQAAAAPAVLLQPTFVMSVGRLAAITEKGAAAKQVATAAEALALATISVLTADLERTGRQAALHWREMVPTWRSAYPSWDECIASAVVVSPALAMLSGGDDLAPESPDTYESEAVFARLLPAWEAFVSELPDASRASSLSAMLRQAAETVGVVPMGEKGAIVSYDPLSHHLDDEQSEPPSQVRVVRPGVQVLRADGSARVLVPALVATVKQTRERHGSGQA